MQQVAPTAAPTQLTDQEKRTNKLKLVWGLLLLIAPTAVGLAGFILYALVNLAFGVSGISSPVVTVVNVILFIINLVCFLAWLPGLITGIILLATRKPSYVKN